MDDQVRHRKAEELFAQLWTLDKNVDRDDYFGGPSGADLTRLAADLAARAPPTRRAPPPPPGPPPHLFSIF